MAPDVARRQLTSELPLVSVILTTRDRPRLFRVALSCYQQQTYPRRELIVVDDGHANPVDVDAVAAAGGRVVRSDSGTALGTKLNQGVAEAHGSLCQKMDDDDWYAPGFLERMVTALRETLTLVCRPTVAFLMPFRFFDVGRWEVRQSVDNNAPGATLLFAREEWQETPFRGLPQDEDVWFLLDQLAAGSVALPVRAPDTYLAVRHRGSLTDRGHTWTHRSNGQTLESSLLERSLYKEGPEALVPMWALDIYRDVQREILGSDAAEQFAS
jgi:glycosyltransferase involved in cell wall biosynthesis